MSKRYGESMSAWEREQEERDWKRRCSTVSAENREKILALIEEGIENDYDSSVIEELEKL